MSNPKKSNSPMVQSVLDLDYAFSELARLGAKIESMDLETEADFERVQKLMVHFSQTAEGVATGVQALSIALNEERSKAEATAAMVAAKSQKLQSFQDSREKKIEAFRLLGEKVQALNESLVSLRREPGETVTDEDRAKISMRLTELDMQIKPLIEEAFQIKKDAQSSNLIKLEQDAHSMHQSLTALTQKLESLQKNPAFHS